MHKYLMADVIKPVAHAIFIQHNPPKPSGGLVKKDMKITEDGLVSALSQLNLVRYVTEVNPEVKP